MCDRVCERFSLSRVYVGELETGGGLMFRDETAFSFDDERLRGIFVTSLTEVDGVIRVQELEVLNIGIGRGEF